MINPFVSAPRISDLKKLLHREQQVQTLESYMESRINAVLSGPEGSGKSTLLNCFFNLNYLRQMAEEKTLIILRQFPTGQTGAFAYGYFADAIRSAVETLEIWGFSVEASTLLRALDQKQYDSNMSRFSDYLDKVHAHGYHVVFVLDNFENFTSAPEINADCHDLLCGMLNNYKLQMIVATNYDFNKTSLPAGGHNSTLLSRLSPNKIAMDPLEPKECEAMLNATLERKGMSFRFSPEQMQFLYELSGGIPLLVNMTAKHCFQALAEEDPEEESQEDWKSCAREHTLAEAYPTIKLWCKVMSPEQMALLQNLPAPGTAVTDTEGVAAAALLARGILQDAYFIDRKGRRRKQSGVLYNCGLLKAFAANQAWMQEAAESNPFARFTPAEAPGEDPSACNLFISYKATWHDQPTRDAEIAREVYEHLRKLDGVKPFLDKAELQKDGNSEFRATISRALDSAKIFVYVCTNPDFLEFEKSPYVYKEWSTYVNELDSGRKPKGSVFGVTNAAIDDLPIDLRKYEMLPCSQAGIESLLGFIRSKMQDILSAPTP